MSHKAARVETLDGQLEFHFAVDEGVEAVYHSLLNNSFDEHSLSRHAVLQAENCELIVTICLPQPGEYALELFAGLKKDNGEQIVHNVCNYFIHCLDVKFSSEPFPKLHEGMGHRWLKVFEAWFHLLSVYPNSFHKQSFYSYTCVLEVNSGFMYQINNINNTKFLNYLCSYLIPVSLALLTWWVCVRTGTVMISP